MTEHKTRYNGIAIGLHWLIAILIIGMFAVGKFMTGLEDTDPLRYALTQWHKSFGIAILGLSLFRLLWRITHRPPSLPEHMPGWEKFAASATHVFFYLLIIGIPLTGWIMVSASPLNLPTVLFKLIPWPHLPPFDSLSNKEEISHLFLRLHALSSNLLAVLLIMHVAAALRHHFVLKDSILLRMSPISSNGQFVRGFGKFAAVLIVACTSFLVYGAMQKQAVKKLVAGDSQVRFSVPLMGEDLIGVFTESSVQLNLDASNLKASTLTAIVPTGQVESSEASVTNSLPGPEWFDSTNYPEASFTSTEISAGSTADDLLVTGDLTIKEYSSTVTFPLFLTNEAEKTTAKGGFTINRLDYDIGKVEQPDDSTVGFNVLIEFSFDVK